MKKQLPLIALALFLGFTQQSLGQEVTLQDLAVPNSSAVILVDESTTNLITPGTPKEFAIGLIQSFNTSSNWFGNYTAEFAPYWWIKPKQRDFNAFVGFKKDKATHEDGSYKQNIFHGLKFTSVSVALVNKDMIPNASEDAQAVLSVGVRTTLIKVKPKQYLKKIADKTTSWQSEAQEELNVLGQSVFGEANQDALDQEALKKEANKSTNSRVISSEISDLVNAKPQFQLDLAAAYAAYGVGGDSWSTGRAGAWMTGALYINMKKHDKDATKAKKQDDRVLSKNYFDVLGSIRYMHDNYVQTDNGTKASSSIDLGAKVGFEFNRFSVFAEGMFRYVCEESEWNNRVMGIVNFRILDNLYAQASIGQQLAPENKLITLAGLNWGFGSEKVDLTPTN
jgi:hypothetical protein